MELRKIINRKLLSRGPILVTQWKSFDILEKQTNSKGEGFSAKLWSIDLTGYNERLITTETDASDPSWSSLLSN